MKLLPIVLLPLYWKRVRIRDAALAVSRGRASIRAVLNHAGHSDRFARHLRAEFPFNDPVFAMLECVTAPQLVDGLAVLVGFLTAIWLRRKVWICLRTHLRGRWPHRFCVRPSYIRGICFGSCRSFGRRRHCRSHLDGQYLPTYTVWHLRARGQLWILPGWVMPLEYGAVAVTAALTLVQRLRGQPAGRN